MSDTGREILIEAQRQRIADLETETAVLINERDAAEAANDALRAENAALRVQLATPKGGAEHGADAWTPVPDGQYGSLLVEDDGSSIAVALYEDDGQRYWQGCGLGDDMRLYQRQPTTGAAREVEVSDGK